MEEKAHGDRQVSSRFGVRMPIGIGVGLAVGVALENIADVIAIGAGTGVVFGAGWGRKTGIVKGDPNHA